MTYGPGLVPRKISDEGAEQTWGAHDLWGETRRVSAKTIKLFLASERAEDKTSALGFRALVPRKISDEGAEQKL